MTYLIVNDLHLGVSRVAGTTPKSREALGDYLQSSFRDLIFEHTNKNILILGDLFESFEVEQKDLLTCYLTLSAWLVRSKQKLILVAGNHDSGKRTDRVSSFDVLSRLLVDRFTEERVDVISRGLRVLPGNIYVIPHMPNQDLFNLEIGKLEGVERSSLLLHCNYNNHFAEISDASLNITDTWASDFVTRGNTILLAHEHQQKQPRKGVQILGNQYPSSISDCLGNDRKCAWILYGE